MFYARGLPHIFRSVLLGPQLGIHARVQHTTGYVDCDYVYGLCLAEPAFDVLCALLGDARQRCLLIAQQAMGLPALYKAILDGAGAFHTVFYAEECPSARYWVEQLEHGSDTRFYHLLRHGNTQGKYLEEMFGDMSFHGQHRFLRQAHQCDTVIAVGNYVAEELHFLNEAFHQKSIDICYHGIPALPVTLAEKLASRRLLQEYTEAILGYRRHILMTHVARPIRCKALWRDLHVCHWLEPFFAERGQQGVLYMVCSAHGARAQHDLLRMEEYGWPRYHRIGYPDLISEEIALYHAIETFNAKHKSIQILLVNSFDWPSGECSGLSPGRMTRLDLRRATDIEFGQSMYEAFGISQRLSGNKAFITEHFRSYAGQGSEQTYWTSGFLPCF